MAEQTEESLKQTLDEIREERKKIDAKLQKAYNRWVKFKENKLKALEFDPKMFTPEFLENELAEFGEITAQYELVKRFYSHYTSQVTHDGCYLYVGEMYKGKRYPSPQVSLDKDQTNHSDIIRALKAIARFVGEEEIQISVFENTCSEFGSYYIKYRPNEDKARLVIFVYSTENEIISGTLKEVLVYCSKNHYYGSEDNYYYDDYDEDY